jgi:type VI secretion system protein ImpM
MPACGFYGKIPSEGDFVSRRLPWEFTSVWDDWLQQGMLASRTALGARWLDLYLAAPIWRFQVAPGVCGPQGWRGLFFASVDRVGRYFPLTLAFAEGLDGTPAPALATLTSDDPTWLAAEDVALGALDPGAAIDDVDRLIEALAMPAAGVPAAVAPTASARPLVCLYTPGGHDIPPSFLSLAGLPPPTTFVDLIAPPVQPPVTSSLLDLL